MLKITLIILMLFIFQMASAQLSITGKVTDENETPIEFVKVILQQE